MASLASMTGTSKKVQKMTLNQIPYIYYLVQFQKGKKEVIRALINFGSKINTIIPTYISKLCFKTHGIGFANFQIIDTIGKARFSKKHFY